MAWASNLAGYKEVPGTVDPVVFKYPARSTSAVLLAVAFVILAIGWHFAGDQEMRLRLFFGAPILIGGATMACFGLWHLLVLRRIEAHPARRQLVEIRRTPLGGQGPRVIPFDQIRHITVTRKVGLEDGTISDTIVVELKDGGHVDFGNYVGPAGSIMAARLHDLTGASILSQPAH